MRGAKARPSNPQRYPSRRVWLPHDFKGTCCQSFSPWFFLADCSRRCQRLGPKMQRVPEVPLEATSAGFCTQDYPHCLALCCLGPGHGGTIQNSMRWHDSSACRSGQVHQEDRSKTDQEIEWSDCCDFHLRHHHPVWHTTQHHHRQWHKLCQRCLGPFPRDVGHPTGPSVCCSSAVKRPGGASKRPYFIRHQAPTG